MAVSAKVKVEAGGSCEETGRTGFLRRSLLAASDRVSSPDLHSGGYGVLLSVCGGIVAPNASEAQHGACHHKPPREQALPG